jgi:hypothetical protein
MISLKIHIANRPGNSLWIRNMQHEVLSEFIVFHVKKRICTDVRPLINAKFSALRMQLRNEIIKYKYRNSNLS